MKDILRRIDLIVTDQFICLPPVSQPVIIPGIENLCQQIEKVDIELRSGFFGPLSQFCHIHPRRYGCGTFAVFRKMAKYALAIIRFLVNYAVVTHRKSSSPLVFRQCLHFTAFIRVTGEHFRHPFSGM
jgi:hypothetical protein